MLADSARETAGTKAESAVRERQSPVFAPVLADRESQSVFIATIGSTRVARRPGTQAANSEIRARASETLANVAGTERHAQPHRRDVSTC
jgi:hypothetical protein